MGSPTKQRFAVFRDPENPPESWRSWSAYTRDFSTTWRGFVGFYEGHGATRRERKADAIKRARADNCEPMDGIDPTPTPPAPADDARRCEGCNAPAVTTDPEDVPLCRPCAKTCDEATAFDRGPAGDAMRYRGAPADDAGGAVALTWASGALLATLGVYRDKMPHDAVIAFQVLADKLGNPLLRATRDDAVDPWTKMTMAEMRCALFTARVRLAILDNARVLDGRRAARDAVKEVEEAAKAAFIAFHRDFYGPAKWDYAAEWTRRIADPVDPIVARWKRVARAALRGPRGREA